MLSEAASIRRNARAVPGLLLWLDASSLSAEGNVTSWANLAGGTDAVPQSQLGCPQFSRTGLAGRPAVLFNGAYDAMTLPYLAPGSSWVAFAVLRRDGGPTYSTVFQVLSGSGAQAAQLAINNDSTKGPVQVSSSGSHRKGGSFGTGVARILTVTGSSIKQNNVSATTSSISSPFTAAGTASMIAAANSTAPSRFFAGAISEIRLYSSLSAGQEASIYAELAEKWGVS